MANSFYRRMIEEKGLEEEIMTVKAEQELHLVEMGVLLDVIEGASVKEKAYIKDTMSKIDFLNGDIMHFMNHLAQLYILENYTQLTKGGK